MKTHAMDKIGLFRTKFLVYFLLLAVVFTACSKKIYVPVEHTEYVHITDSVAVHDTTVSYQIEKQYVRDYTGLLDTLVLETDYAIARAHVDTAAAKLSGSIENKRKTVEIPVQWKERIVYKDSISTKEIPVEVEKPVPYTPRIWKFLGIVGILSLVVAVLWILRKLGILKIL